MSVETEQRAPVPPPSRAEIPPLESGDHLTRPEFERRYEAMGENVQAELIEGVVYVASPVRFRNHGRPHALVNTLLGTYSIRTPGLETGDNATLRIDLENEPQPDVLLRIDEACGGRTTVDDEDYIVGGPELVFEIAASSASLDLGSKKRVYQRCGVAEYIVWRVLDQAIDHFVLREGAFVEKAGDAEGLLKSEVFPGLWLAPAAMIEGDSARALDAVNRGIASPEHAAFVERLAV